MSHCLLQLAAAAAYPYRPCRLPNKISSMHIINNISFFLNVAGILFLHQ